jgi:hypothetical protein
MMKQELVHKFQMSLLVLCHEVQYVPLFLVTLAEMSHDNGAATEVEYSWLEK